MDVGAFLESLRGCPDFEGQLQHVEILPNRAAQYQQLDEPLSVELTRLLGGQGIERLYTHQVDAIETTRQGRDCVVVTGTASGKTLCYNVPILEGCLRDPEARALYLFPTKALAQDQFQGLLELVARRSVVRRKDPARCLRWRYTSGSAATHQSGSESRPVQSGHGPRLVAALPPQVGSVL